MKRDEEEKNWKIDSPRLESVSGLFGEDDDCRDEKRPLKVLVI